MVFATFATALTALTTRFAADGAGRLADLAARFGALVLAAVFLGDLLAGFLEPLRDARALGAVFFFACFFAFFAGRAGFFRAMTDPFRLS
ncbi:MAG: hypothetical protein ABI024_10225 [Vicinamibacterales bacterium]